jgi:hypothetical protein
MALHWVAPPYGVAYFEVLIGTREAPPSSLGSEFTDNQLPEDSQREFLVGGVPETLNVGSYLSGRVGQGFGTAGSGEFEVIVPIELGKRYVVSVVAHGRCGVGEMALPVVFSWSQPETGPEVPWPARDLPDVVENFHPGLEAVWLPNNPDISTAPMNQAAIRVGQFPWDPDYDVIDPKYFVFSDTTESPAQYIYERIAEAETLLPIVVYRRQVPSAALPDVSGDLVQVTPLVEGVTHRVVAPDTALKDPFFLALPDLQNLQDPEYGHLYLLDTQPVIRGAAYQYYVVRFDDRFEPLDVIALDPLEIPE